MTTTDARRNLAAEYADDMVASVAEIMGRLDGSEHDDECERADECDCQTGAWSGRVTDTERHEPLCDMHDAPCECQERARAELDESYALELVAEIGEPYSVLLTYGGPTAYVEWSGRSGTSSATLHVSWGSDSTVRRSAAIRALADHYAETMELGE